MLYARAVLTTVLAGLPIAGLWAQPRTFQDGDFTGWQCSAILGQLGGAVTATRQPAGGNPGAYLEVRLQSNGTGGVSFTTAWAFCESPSARYNPGAPGNAPIDSLDYSEDARHTTATGIGVALRQDGRIYVRAFGQAFNFANWTRRELTGLKADDFSLLSSSDLIDTTAHPDFSVAGKEISFGFLRAVTSQFLYTGTSGIDNWSLVLRPPPTPSSVRVSTDSLTFRAVAGGAPPSSQSVVAVSTDGFAQELSAVIEAAPGGGPPPAGLTVSPSTPFTPARFVVSFNNPQIAPGTYTAQLTVRARGAFVAVILAQIPITIVVESRAAALAVAPAEVRLTGRTGFAAPEAVIVVRNAGSGGLACAQVTASADVPWLSATVDASLADCRVRVRPDLAALRPDAYVASVGIRTPIGNASVAVSLLVLASGPVLALNPSGFQFDARQGAGASINRNIAVLNTGDGRLTWTVRAVNAQEAGWLLLGATSGASTAVAAGSIPIRVDTAALAAGAYYALLEVDSPEAANSPQLFTVTLRVFDPNSSALGTPSPSGITFVVDPGGAGGPQNITVFASSATPVPYQVSAQTFTGGNWLRVAPASGNTSTAVPAVVAASAVSGTLAPGVYRGEVTTIVNAAGSSDLRAVNATLIVRAPAPLNAESSALRRADCVPSILSATHTGLVSNFATVAAWPTPLNVRVIDDCGNLVTAANVIVSFNNGDPPIALNNLANGNYAGTWTPRGAAAAVGLTADIFAGNLSQSIELLGGVRANLSPIVAAGGVISNLFPRAGAPLAPGIIASIYGFDLGARPVETPVEGGRLPTSFADLLVVIGGLRAPLYYLSPNQVNVQLPYELRAGQQYVLVVRSGTAYSVPQPVLIAAAQPGLLASAGGDVIAQDQEFRLVDAANPAERGRVIVVYLIGLGATVPPVASGALSPGDPPARVVALPEVTIGGRAARVLFAGLTPGFAGLYQINVEVPADVEPGVRDFVVRQSGVNANAARIPVR